MESGESGSKADLQKTLTLNKSIALALGIIIGAGLLALPGIAYQQSGNASIYAWVIDGALVIPLLVIFSYLGSRYPKADGLSGFLYEAFGPIAGAGTQVLLIGTFALGIPGIAIVGGKYFAFFVGGNQLIAFSVAGALLFFAGIFNFLGARLAGGIQQLIAYSLVIILFVVTAIGVFWGNFSQGTGVAAPSSWYRAIPSLGLVFFAFTGWEMLSFTAEEYKNPRRDYPITVIVSFVIVMVLYLGLSLATQLTLSPDDTRLSTAPIAAILATTVGSQSGKMIAVLAILIIIANLNGATWAASRLVFATARKGILPKPLASLNNGSGIPRNAVIATAVLFLLLVTLSGMHILPQKTLLGLAGQNFFILYVLSVLAYMKLVRSYIARFFGVLTLMVCCVMMGTFGWTLLYPAFLFFLGMLIYKVKNRRKHLSEMNINTK